MLEAAAMNLLEDWCRGMEVDIRRSLLVTGIPEDCGQAELEETLSGVLAPLGPYRVLNKIFLREENVKAALIEVGEGVNLSAVPREFAGRGGVWKVARRDPTQDAEFLKNLNEFLDAEGRTWEDVVRLLQLNRSPPPQSVHQASETWAEALGVLLGAVVQVVLCMDAEIRSRQDARAQEAAEGEQGAAWASAVGRKVKKEPGLATEVGLALKMENSPPRWKGVEDQGDLPKPIVRRAGAKARSRRKKQKKSSKQEPVLWKRRKGSHCSSLAYSEGPEARETQSMEIPESGKSHRKARVKQEGPASKQPMGTSTWKVLREPPQDALAGAKSPTGFSESDQDGGQERLMKKAMSWASGKSPIVVRKKKVTLGPVSYALVESEDAKKKLVVPKKGLRPRRAALAQEALCDRHPATAPASTSRCPKVKAAGCPRASNGLL
ncbi:paraneoplastic antigen-like protein 8A [Octodon degus]|uniref:Paraneoplastic antigen-like protein 8A n=1 Tax=Octodon degus TaxID=10160 RepID=A0A6P3FEX2_OCTDE|nr:paraneoplastic antigen-like protein 8A [Octodon degus]